MDNTNENSYSVEYVSDAIREIRNKINDRDGVGLDDLELLSYLNEAIQYIAGSMISAGSRDLVDEIVWYDGTSSGNHLLPTGFVRLCGNYPVKITGNSYNLLVDGHITVRYFHTVSPVQTTDSMPFRDTALNQIAIKLACIYANAQQKLDVGQDKTIVQEISQAIAASMGAGA